MGHIYPADSDLDPVDIVAWWVEQARGPRGIVERAEEEESDE